MGLGGLLLAYLGAIVRWLFSGCKGTINKFYLGEESDDIYSGSVKGILNRLIGLIVIIVFMFIVGYLYN
jgi:hypothetical protein